MFKYKKRKGVVSITTFVFLIFIMISILAFSYSYYSTSKSDFELKIKQREVLNSVSSFRASLVDFITLNQSELNYSNDIDDIDIIILLDNQFISGSLLYDNDIANVNISSLGITFCSNYSFTPKLVAVFLNNNTCIGMISS